MRKKIISTLFMICIMLLLSPKRAEASEGTYVAQINENQYETLQEAVEEASGTYPIILLEDITLSEAILIQKSSNITLDLNGKTIDGGACVMNTAPIIKGYTVKISASDTYVNGTGLSLFSRVGFADNITNYKYIKIEKGPDNVAKIGSTNYTTLQAAFSAASNNQTIQLIEEIYNVNSVNIATDNNNNITLDLNGKAIIVEVPAIIHEGKGTLTITDNTGGEGRICTSIGYYSPLPIHLKGGSLSVTGGILDGGFYTAIENEGTGSISVSGGTVKSSSSSYSPTIYSSQGGKITISGNATIISAFIYESSDISAIYQTGGNPDDTVIEITGGTIENISDFGYAIYARNTGNIVVSGGSIIAKKYSAIRAYYKDG